MRNQIIEMMKKILNIFVTFVLIMVATKAYAGDVPDLMVGQTTVTINDTQNSYYGMGGSYAVYNASMQDGYSLNSSLLNDGNGCQGTNITTPRCYIFGHYITGVSDLRFSEIAGRMLTSRTRISDSFGFTRTVLETPAIFYGERFSIGDLSAGAIIKNLKLWGKNLAQSKLDIDPNVGATWSLSKYTVNNNSQSAWPDDTDMANSEYSKFIREIGIITAEGTLTNSVPDKINLQSGNGSLSNLSTEGSSKYPEGRVWMFKNIDSNLVIDKDITYSGVGTIVANSLTVKPNVKIKPKDPNSSNNRLGFILTGNDPDDPNLLPPDKPGGLCDFEGNNEIQAMIFCQHKFTVKSDNLTFKGSFVSKNFDIPESSKNIGFYYDQTREDKVPPGFRYLRIPTPQEKGNSSN